MGIAQVRLVICITNFMGDFKLYRTDDSSIRLSDFVNVCFHSLIGLLDDTWKKMTEIKAAVLLLTLVGVPAYIYAWFLEVHNTFDLWKGIVLTIIAAFTGLILALRYLVKLISEIHDLKNKMKGQKPKKATGK